jgi:plastocyanin
MTKSKITRALAAALVAFMAAAVANADPSAVHSIVVNHLAYGRAPEGLRIGDIIEWSNADIFRHTATATDGSFDIDLPPGAKGRTVLKREGAIHYFCRFHPGMKGALNIAP